MRILKQVLEISDKQTYLLPGNKVSPLCAANQNGNLVLYFESDANADEIFDRGVTTPVTICIAGTGHERNDLSDYIYLGTVIMPYGLTWHCYYKHDIGYDF